MDKTLTQLFAKLPDPGRVPGMLNVWDLRVDYSRLRAIAQSGGVEWGACVVRSATPDRLVLDHEVPGKADAVSPGCPPGTHVPYLGFAHVHLPMDFAHGAITVTIAYAGFSDRDYQGSLTDQERMSLVTNGDDVFAIVRTDRTPPITQFSASDFDDWAWRYDNAIRQAKSDIIQSGATASAALNRRLFAVNESLCQLLQFGYYAGRWGAPLRLIYQPR